MSLIVEEGQLRFEFEEGWSPIAKWDDHPAYLNGIMRSPSARAVDFVGLYEESLYFIEVKDYRVHPRMKEEEHRVEFEKKVRDTVSGLVGAYRNGHELCERLVRAMVKPNQRMVVIYWIELPENDRLEDVTRRNRRKVASSVRTQQGKGSFNWLRARYLEMNKAEQDGRKVIPGLKVSHLPSAGQPPPDSP